MAARRHPFGGETGAAARALGAGDSPLGPVTTWPPSLRTALDICLGSRFPTAIYWGPTYAMLYNDALIPLVGAKKHPWAFGRPAFEVVPELRELLEPWLQRVHETGESILAEDLMLPIIGHLAPEESYFTFTCSPIHDEAGGIGGVFCAAVETTDKLIEVRRLRLLNALAHVAQTRTPAEACAVAAAEIARAPADVPFALIYLLDDAGTARLAGAANLDPADPRALASAWSLTAPARGGASPVVTFVEPIGGARGAVILPIDRASGGAPLGFIVAGLSALLRTSPSYERFHDLLAASVAQGVRNAAAHAAAAERIAALTDLDRAQTTFVHNVSHELRTPIALILAPIADLLETPATPAADPITRHVDGGGIAPAGSAAEGRRGAVDGGGIAPAASAAEGRRGAVDGGGIAPAGSAADGRRGAVDEAARWGAPDAGRSAPSGEGRPRILVADDDLDTRVYLARLLGERWDVATASTGAEALAQIRRAPPALVLAEVRLPALDGFELVAAMRQEPALAAIPVLLLSAHAGAQAVDGGGIAPAGSAAEGRRGVIDGGGIAPAGSAAEGRRGVVARGLRAGATDYIAKPFVARDVVHRVAVALATAATVELVRAREQAQREKLYRPFMQAPFALCVLRGPDHVIELANAPVLAAWGRGPEVVGRPIRTAVPELVGSPFLAHLDAVARTGLPHTRRAERVRLPTGPAGALEEAFYDYMCAPLHDAAGACEGVLLSAFDVTETVRARRSAEGAAAAQRTVRQFQERFVAVLGHDLRNPLSSIGMGTSFLRKGAVDAGDARAVRVIDRIEASTQRMARMVSQILDLSRARLGGGIAIAPQPMELGATLARVIDELRIAHPARTIELQGPPVAGHWDADRLEQVFSNLIANALAHGLATAPVKVAVTATAEAVQVDVHNDGPGIPAAVRDEIFDPFRRGERDSRGSRTAGLGLGLFISREIVTGHGGTVAVVGDEAEGTTLRVILPRVAPVVHKEL